MDHKQNYGIPSGQLVEREPLDPNLYMRIGIRVGTITAYYEYMTTNTVAPASQKPNPPQV